jgi:hypothetical protein
MSVADADVMAACDRSAVVQCSQKLLAVIGADLVAEQQWHLIAGSADESLVAGSLRVAVADAFGDVCGLEADVSASAPPLRAGCQGWYRRPTMMYARRRVMGA